MKDPTGIFGFEMDGEFIALLRQIPAPMMEEFLQRCKQRNYERLDGATNDEERHAVQVRSQFVDEWRNFFKTLLTKPQKPTNI
jgi:hypothetical protein